MKNGLSGASLSMRYARALYDAASENGFLQDAEEDMERLDTIISEIPEIRRYCLEKRINRASEIKFIDTAFLPYVSEYTGRMLTAAVRNGRMSSIPFISGAFGIIAERESEIVRVLVEAAREPDEETLEKIEKQLRKRIGKNIRIQVKIAASLLGGVRISWENRIIDMSAAGRLRDMCAMIKSV